jgi:DNA repair protein RecN (Recombination protein N)
MLLNLKISNVALIEDIEIQFIKGLNILSGETGAGKSIILDSLSLILGEMGRTDFIRHNKDEAKIHALFDIEGDLFIKNYLKDSLGIETPENLLIIERHIFREKPTVALINHQRVLVQALKDLGVYLIDIHSQHQNQQLFHISQHIRILDRYAHIENLVKDYQQTFEKAVAVRKEIEEIRQKNSQIKEMEQFYEFTLNELTKANLQNGELEELEEDIIFLSNLESIKQKINRAYNLLYHDDNSAITQLQYVKDILADLVSEIKELQELPSLVEESLVKLEPVLDLVKIYREKQSISPEDLDNKKNRYHFLKNLESKYKKSIKELITYKQELEEMMGKMSGESQEALLLKKGELLEELIQKSAVISAKRIEVSKKLEENIQKELLFLKLNDVQFKVSFSHIEDENGNVVLPSGKRIRLLKDGLEKVEFLISFNRGQDLKPLTKIASGGEVSRVMLALKNIFHQIDVVATQVFDEIDTGIGGETAFAMAQKLKEMAHYKQLICITHLAQIAAMGELQYQVKKIVEDNQTQTIIVPLSEQERVNEISRMLSGDLISEASIKHAKELLALRESKIN